MSLGALFAVLLIFASPPAATARPDRDCRIHRAEATICPALEHFAFDDFRVQALSGDGTTLVGEVGHSCVQPPLRQPVVRTNGVTRPLGPLPSPYVSGYASAVSGDASTVAGALFDALCRPVIFRWRDGAFEIFDFGLSVAAVPTHMSGDGRVTAGWQEGFGFVWEEGQDPELWLSLEGQPMSPAGMSDDGRVIVGTAVDSANVALERRDGVTTQLLVPGFTFGAFAMGIAPDASLILGRQGPDGLAWRNGIVEWLPFRAVDASWEGRFLSGAADGSGFFGEPALLWNTTGDPRELAEILTQQGVDVPVPLAFVRQMSDDGHVLFGSTGPAQTADTFRAVVSPKLGLDIEPRNRANRIDLGGRDAIVVRVFGSEQADVASIAPDDLAFGPARTRPIGARPPTDRNRDGYPDRDFEFDPATTGLSLGDREACLAGVVEDLPFRLCSRVRPHFAGCGRGTELALVLPIATLLRRRTRCALRRGA